MEHGFASAPGAGKYAPHTLNWNGTSRCWPGVSRSARGWVCHQTRIHCCVQPECPLHSTLYAELTFATLLCLEPSPGPGTS